MFKPKAADPGIIGFSTKLYSALLKFYPPRFRQEYGLHMAQVFRDCCLTAFRLSGPAGLLPLWILTLFDWLKTVVEEQLHRETDITRQKFVRLGGWALILAAITFLLTFLQPDPNRIRLGLYRLFGPPVTQEAYSRYITAVEAVEMIAYFCAILFTVVGLLGLLAEYGARAGRAARGVLGVGAASGAAGLLSIALLVAGTEIAWMMMVYAIGVMFATLFIFGIIAWRLRTMPRGSALPILAGFWIPFILIFSTLYRLFSGTWLNVSGWLSFVMFSAMSFPLIALGYVMQSNVPTPAGQPSICE